MHHPVRRRKRRSHNGSFCAIGARCVDILRGPQGFGFTISGQQPCLLSCIVAGSPAEAAGLNPGLALVSVNGRNVARLPHDTVVRLIGGCMSLRLRVSENHYPHSSDSDLEDVDSYLPSSRREGRAARVLRDLHSGVLFSEVMASPPLQLPPRGVQNPPPPPPPSRIHPIDFRAVVGYLGTIELPRVLLPGSRLAVIRSCVRRMRAEKRVHTVVTLSVRRESSVILSDTSGSILAEFPAERVAFCGSCADDKRFFGLVTNVAALEEDEAGVCGEGSSCHVFMVEPALHSHKTHADQATAFHITCTPCGAGCAEFPAQAEPILRAVAALHSPRSPPPPPPRSNTSNSSNSDSGIGFPSEQERLTVRAMPDPPILIKKLSPKVFPSSSQAAHSFEDIPLLQPSGDESMSSLEQQQHWGSLQDLRASPGRLVRRRTHHQHPCCLALPHMMAPPVPQLLELQQLNDNDDAHIKEADARATSRSHSEGGSELGTSSRGPTSCIDSFERLLDDPSGMHAFAEFLKKEFSHENIYFWVACEKYRRLDGAARKTQAKAIFQRHLAAGALEPVNVDSQARQSAREGLEQAKVDLFVSAQKQIFNLMKFDSYPRYLKCSESALEPASALIELDPDLSLHVGDEPNPGKLKKSRSDAEDRRRKSLLPWHRGGCGKSAVQSRSKSRDRADTPGVPDDSSSLRSELTGSRSSLASSDLALIQRGSSSRQSLSSGGEGNAELCRVLLPDGATTVIPTQRGETTKQLILRLLDKRGLHFSSFELFMEIDTKAVVLSEDSTILSGKEVRVERRVVFRLDLPSRKTVGVKAKAGRTLSEVLKPILHKYGYRIENTTVTLICDTEPLDPNLLITAVENQRLKATVSGPDGWQQKGSVPPSKNGATLDEITNRVFEELLQCKSGESTEGDPQQESTALSDQDSVRSEDWSSEHSSGIFGRFLRRDSAFLDKTRESRSKSKKLSSNKLTSLELEATKLSAMSSAGASVSNVSVKTKWKLRPQAQGKSECDDLYEGLKRAQRSRLEDQRGTEINFQLPDFLKDKENTPEQARRLKKGRLGEGECVPLLTSDGIDLSVSEGIIPSPGQADIFFSSAAQSVCELAPLPPMRHANQPPPLPPKPKTVTRPNWQSASEDEGKSFSQSATSYV